MRALPTGRPRRMMHRLALPLLLTLFPAPPAAAPLAGSPAGDLAIINGHVFSHAPVPQAATAVLIRDGRFAVVGGNQEVIKAATPGTPVIDLKGWFLYPGFHDSHSRLGECGPAALEISLDGVASLTALSQALRDSLPSVPRGGWLVGMGWDPRVVRGARVDLDGISRTTPLLLRTRDGHAAWLNSRALEALGVKPALRDPDDGWFERDAAGGLTGVCFEGAAFQVIERWVNSASVQQVAACIEQNVMAAAQRGVVGFHDASPYARRAEAFTLLATKGRLKARVVEMPMPQLAAGYGAWSRLRTTDSTQLSLGPDLIVVDGSLSAGTA